ncbi:MAG: polyhydroxyalkanoate synthesis regulator phasin [Myxococcota bacterium]|jgi:polyhydroxyalkanoate synthesis regulator phasin
MTVSDPWSAQPVLDQRFRTATVTRMITALKERVEQMANQVLGATPAGGVFSHPAIQGFFQKAVSFRSDLQDTLDSQVSSLARRFNLVTKQELRHFKRLVRELENQVASLEGELVSARKRADDAEKKTQAPKPAAKAKPATKKAAAKPAAQKPAAKKPAAKT